MINRPPQIGVPSQNLPASILPPPEKDVVEELKAENARLKLSLKSIGEEAWMCGSPTNSRFAELVMLIADEVAKYGGLERLAL